MPVTTTLPNANDHEISLQTAIDMTSLYRTNRESILQNNYQGREILPLSETFNRAAIENLLANEACAALRIYYGMDENEKVHAIIVGVDENNKDILPVNPLKEEDGPIIIEVGQRCPPSCPPASGLNT